MTVNPELEQEVVANALRDMAYYREAAAVIEPKQLTNPAHVWIWRQLTAHVELSSELPDSRVWSEAIKKRWPNPKDPGRVEVSAALLYLLKLPITHPRSALEHVREFRRVSAARRGVEGAMKAVMAGDPAAAITAFHDATQEYQQAQAGKKIKGGLDIPTLFALPPAGSGASVPSPANDWTGFQFKTGLDELDNSLEGGLDLGGFGLIIAQANVGKSTLLTQLGWAALTTHPEAVVLHVATEESMEELEARYFGRFGGVNRGAVRRRKLDPNDDAMARQRLHRQGNALSRLRLLALNTEDSLDELRRAFDSVRAEFGSQPLLLLIDSPDHLSPPAVAKGMDYRHQVAHQYKWLQRQVSRDNVRSGPCSTWAVSWAKVTTEGKKMTVNSASESAEKGRLATYMIGVTEGESIAADRTKEMTISILKNRQGYVNNHSINVLANHGTGEWLQKTPGGSGP